MLTVVSDRNSNQAYTSYHRPLKSGILHYSDLISLLLLRDSVPENLIRSMFSLSLADVSNETYDH